LVCILNKKSQNQAKKILKKIIHPSLIDGRRLFINFFNTKITSIKRSLKKYFRLLSPSKKEGYNFVILCVKKTVYAEMAIENINSLHYLNSNHIFQIHCDDLCENYLNSIKNKINYSNCVSIKNTHGQASKPWQYYKIETLINASRQNAILIDADGIWHEDPIINTNVITLLVLANKISEKLQEKQLVIYEFQKAQWENFNHYVTGFISIPASLMSEKLANEMRIFNDKIFTSQLNFIDNTDSKVRLRRLSEELAINLALQSNFTKEKFSTLKNEDGPGNQKSLQSLYYGCCNNVND